MAGGPGGAAPRQENNIINTIPTVPTLLTISSISTCGLYSLTFFVLQTAQRERESTIQFSPMDLKLRLRTYFDLKRWMEASKMSEILKKSHFLKFSFFRFFHENFKPYKI